MVGRKERKVEWGGLGMQVCTEARQLCAPVARQLGGHANAILFNDLSQAPTWYAIEHDIILPVFGKRVQDTHEGWMLDGGPALHSALERLLGGALFLGAKQGDGRQFLDGHAQVGL